MTFGTPAPEPGAFFNQQHMSEQQFNPGDHVVKVSGYRYPGIVVAAFQNMAGQWRYVVECTVPEVAGMLHIYNGGQLEKR
jgi:hypothetical protein